MRQRCRVPCFALSVLALLCLRPTGFAQAPAPTFEPATIDAIMQEALRAWGAPGAAIVIVKGDEVLYARGYGVKEAGGSQQVTAETLFAIASTSKAFTTTALAMLVDDGKLRWDDPVSKHLDFFHLEDPLADRQVTLRDLVTHRTGLSRHDLLWLGAPWSREEIIRRIGFVKATQPFRSAYQYQNIMYLTAGYTVGKVSGGTWEEFTQKRLFDPLGMKGANFSSKDAEKAADHATPHYKSGAGRATPTAWRNIDNVGPAGSINAGVRDLGKWIRFQLGDGTFEGKRLLSTARLNELHAPQMVIPLDGSTGVASFTRAMNPDTNMMSYGLGWVVQDYRSQLMVSHGGSIDGFRSQVALLPKHKYGMAILSNLGRTSLPEAVRNSVSDALLGLPKKDWNAHFLGQLEQAEAGDRRREQQTEAKRQKDTKPSRELSAYVGQFAEPAYGKLEVVLLGDKLALRWSSFQVNLDHWHYDTYMARGDALLHNKPVVFTLGADGEVEKLSFLDQEFKRQKPKAGTQ
ncbi:MAG: serine hydrolase [Planctomycetia bacterium]|nr:serine hydrolase [Planctomycetia bacterium]